MEQHAPSVSVIVPTYNRASWLPETVASILGQTRPPTEVLIVDDGSTDNTAEVCRQFPANVRYIRQDNGGVSAARNHGIRESVGEWIAFSDSDDPWEPQKLEVQFRALEAAPQAGWSITGCTVIDLKGNPVSGLQSWARVFGAMERGAVNPEEHFGRWLSRAQVTVGSDLYPVYVGDAFGLLFLGNIVLPSSAVVRRDILLRVGGFDESFRLAEETEFFHRLSASSPVAVVMAPLARYRVGQAVSLVSPGNVVRLLENALESGRRAERLRPHLSDTERRAARRGRSRLLRDLAYAKLSNFDTSGARSTIVQAWREALCRDTNTLGIFLAAGLPARLLRGLHAVKRRWLTR